MPVRSHASAGPTDRELIDYVAAVGGRRDRQAFAGLFAHFAPRLKAYLVRLGSDPSRAEEIVQEAMIQVWRRAALYDSRQASVSTWVYTIARNKRIDLLRREGRPEPDANDPAFVPDPPDAADRMIESRQDGERIRAAIRTLPPEQSDLLRMAFFEDQSHSMIATETKLPLGTVKSRLRLALSRLRESLQEMR